MNPSTFTAAWLVAAALLSSWAVSSASDQAVPVRPAGNAPSARALPPLSVEIDAEISRLAARRYDAEAAAANARDPFAFATPARARTPRPRSEAPAIEAMMTGLVAEPEPVPPPAPRPSLSGVAAMADGVLTAVISFGGELHYVAKGDVIAGRYRIDAITMESVDVFDLVTGTLSRVTFQAPDRTSLVQFAVHPHGMLRS